MLTSTLRGIGLPKVTNTAHDDRVPFIVRYMWTHLCADMCTDMCADMHADMSTDMCGHMCTGKLSVQA